MKLFFILLVCSSNLFAQANPLNVDTSVADIKPVQKVVKEPDFAPKKQEYKPSTNFKPAMNPFSQPQTDFERQQRESEEQSARHTSPGF